MHKISKKGIMFTILAVLMSAIVLTAFFSYKSLPLDDGLDNTKIRIQSINRYTQQTDVYVQAMAKRAGTKTLDFTIEQMIENNRFLQDYDKEFASCLMTGQMNNGIQVINCPANSNILIEIEEFEDFSRERLNIDSQIKVNNVTLSQVDYWNLEISVNYTLTIIDSYARWNETKITKTKVSILGKRDPTYYIMSSSSELYDVKYPMVVTKATITCPSQCTEITSSFNSIVLSKGYMQYSNFAPSFLSRLNNRTTLDEWGIVSIVSPDFIDESLLTPKLRSSMDFEFWKDKTIVATNYKRYDFNNPGVNMNIYGIVGPNYGINGTVVTTHLTTFTNMSNPIYLDNP